MGAPPGGPGREAEELPGRRSAYGAHTIAHRERQGEAALHHHEVTSSLCALKLTEELVWPSTLCVDVVMALSNKRG